MKYKIGDVIKRPDGEIFEVVEYTYSFKHEFSGYLCKSLEDGIVGYISAKTADSRWEKVKEA